MTVSVNSIAILAPGSRILDANGDPVSDGRLKFFEAGTSDPKTVYSDCELQTSLGTIVYTDSGGYPVTTQGGSTKTAIFIGTGLYKIIITDSDDATIVSHDNQAGAIDTSSFSVEFAKSLEPVISLTSSRAALTTDYGKTILANSTAGSITYSLPAAADAESHRIRVRHSGTAGTVSIVASGSETIDGPQGSNAAYQLTIFGDEVQLISTGAGWVAFANYIADGTITTQQLSSAISGAFVQTGSIIPWPHATVPTGYLHCDGSAVSRTTYSDLFAVISDDYGPGDGSTTFNLPDYRGETLRGFDDGSGNDPDAATRTDRGDGTTGDNVGTKQGSAIASHTHGVGTLAGTTDEYEHNHNYGNSGQATGSGGGTNVKDADNSGSFQTGNDQHSHTVTLTGATAAQSGAASESRGRNVSVKWIIFAGAGVASGASAAFHTLLNGTGNPNDVIGNDDDFYIDTNTFTIWGPKAGGSWTGTSYQLAPTHVGTWATSTAYIKNDVVDNDGGSYLCKLAHTSSATDEPGVGANESTYWGVLAARGPQGVDGTDPGLLYTFKTGATDVDPGDGALRINNSDLSAATEIYIDDLDRSSNDHRTTLLAWDDSSNATSRGQLVIARPSDGSQVIYNITGASTANTGYVTLSVTYSSGRTSQFTFDDAISLQFSASGNDGGPVDSVFGRTGAIVAAASDYDITQIDFSASDRIAGRVTSGAGVAEELTATQVRTLINVADGATANTGDMVSTNNLSDVASAATAFSNIKQDASTTATGVVELATNTEYRNNTAGKVLSTGAVWNAMAEVSLTDAATISWDMDDGFDFSVTLGGNRTLANPTNTQVGKRGTIRFIQDGTGSRTLTFGSNYKFAGGTAPTLTTTASADDELHYRVVSSTDIRIYASLDMS